MPPQPWVRATLTRPPWPCWPWQGWDSTAAPPTPQLPWVHDAAPAPMSLLLGVPPTSSMPRIPVGWGLDISLCQASTVLLQRILVQPKKPTAAAIPLCKPPATICHGCQERTAPGFTQTRPQVVLAPKATARGRGGAECHGPWGRWGCRSPPTALGPAGAAAPCPQERPRAAQGCALPLHLATSPCALL